MEMVLTFGLLVYQDLGVFFMSGWRFKQARGKCLCFQYFLQGRKFLIQQLHPFIKS
jgi:hypothetical protein